MADITQAYNILSNPEHKESYDKHSKVLKTFRTKARTLTKENFDELVLKGQQPWIILVYSLSVPIKLDEIQGFWDDFIKANSFVNYGALEIQQFNKTIYPFIRTTPSIPFLVQYLPGGKFRYKTLIKNETIGKRFNKSLYKMA